MEKPISEILEFCIINVDKPSGITSFKTADKVRNILKAKKTGHFGTLDPMVTGVLPIAINRACRLSNYFMKKDKEYVGEMYVHSQVDESLLKKEMDKFVGKIMQKPPVRSRVKRVLRERKVNKFEIIDIKKKGKGLLVKFRSDVQAGTYIRKLISDLGEVIGGAHMVSLRRIRAGIFKEDDSFSLEDIYDAFQAYKDGNEGKLRKMLIPGGIVRQIITSVQVKETIVSGLLNGKVLNMEDIDDKIPNSDLISVFCGERFIGVYIRSDKGFKPEFVKN